MNSAMSPHTIQARSPNQGRGTGPGGSELELRAADRLAGELRATGREIQVQELKVRAGQGPVVAIHAVLAVAGSLLGLLSPIPGAAIVLLTAFSFYGERGLGLFLLSRLLPRRRTRNVVSPPLGAAWENKVDVMLVAGYDAPAAYPFGEWLAHRFDGRLTTDRILFWAGMVPTFAALMLRVAGNDGFGVQLLQTLAIAVLLGMAAAQIDRRLKGHTLGTEEDVSSARDLITAVRELAGKAGGDEPDAGVAICLFGAESDGAAGAEAFYTDRRLKVKPDVAVVGMVAAAPGGRPQATGREGDLAGTAMAYDLVSSSPLEPERVTIRRDTAAGRAARRGARAVTIVGRGEEGLDLLFDAMEGASREKEKK